jgi:hypothetical protein
MIIHQIQLKVILIVYLGGPSRRGLEEGDVMLMWMTSPIQYIKDNFFDLNLLINRVVERSCPSIRASIL